MVVGAPKGYFLTAPVKEEEEDHRPVAFSPFFLLQSREQRQEVRIRGEILSGSCVTLGKSLPLSGPQVEIIITPLHKATAKDN